MALWDHKLELRAPRRARAPRWSRWIAALAARVPAARPWLLARSRRLRAELRRGIARELARPRPDLGLLRSLRHDLESTDDRLADLERGGWRSGAPAAGRRQRLGRPT